MKRLRWMVCLLIVALACGSSALARVVRVKVTSRKLVMGGRAFGRAGAYERLTGKVYFAVAVNNRYNRRIVDLKNAVNRKHGEVAFSADFVAIRPVDVAKGNGSMLLEVPNRGHQGIVRLVDGGTTDLTKVGNAWLLRRGFTVVSLGWQWDAPTGLRLYAPIAKDHGKTIHGLLRGDLMLPREQKVIPLGHDIVGTIGGTEYPVSDPQDPRNVLTVRDTRHGRRRVIPRKEWEFAKRVDGKVVPDRRHIYLKTGFEKGKIYEYVYAVRDPVVAGLGFASIRDFAS